MPQANCLPDGYSGNEEELKRKLSGLSRYTEQLERHVLRIHNLWLKVEYTIPLIAANAQLVRM